MKRRTFHAVALATLLSLVAAVAGADDAKADTAAAAQAASAPAGADQPFAESDFTSTANGQVVLSVTGDSPLLAEFKGSPELTTRLRASLQERGFALAPDAATAKTTLVFDGTLAVLGGKKFHKGVELPVGHATEMTVKAARERGGVTRADVVQGTAGVALSTAAYLSSTGTFLQGLQLGQMAAVLGDLTGVRGWFNNLVAGDPRGICLSRCEDWNKVEQTVYLSATMKRGDARATDVRTMSRVFSERVAPDEVIAFAVARAFRQIRIDDGPPVATR